MAALLAPAVCGVKDLFPEAFREMSKRAPKTPDGIPKVLHQVWKTRDLPPKFQETWKTWTDCLPPDWTRVLWTDEEMDLLVEEKGTAEYLAVYHNYIHPIQKVDSFRVILLKHFGGVYADLDNECIGTPVLPSGCTAALAEQPGHGAEPKQARAALKLQKELGMAVDPKITPVQNSLMASVPGHSFWDVTLSVMIKQGPKYYTLIQQVHITTGVEVVTRALFMSNATFPVCYLPALDWHDPGGKYVRHIGTHTWSTTKGDLDSTMKCVALVLLAIGLVCGWWSGKFSSSPTAKDTAV